MAESGALNLPIPPFLPSTSAALLAVVLPSKLHSLLILPLNCLAYCTSKFGSIMNLNFAYCELSIHLR